MDIFKNRIILITGGTGLFGQEFSKIILKEYKPKIIIIYSKNQSKQLEMQQQFLNYKNIRFLIGDIRDLGSLKKSFKGVDYIVHAAVLKQDSDTEYNHSEVVKTNVIGTMNVIEAALKRKVKKVIALSTDKACNPINLYSTTKLCSDRLFVFANTYRGSNKTKFSTVRYGKIIRSRDGIIPILQRDEKKMDIINKSFKMAGLWIALDEAVRFVIRSFEYMKGGEIFVPKPLTLYDKLT